ncbi:hypothetical protein OROMI_018680 [Orobanche minor]
MKMGRRSMNGVDDLTDEQDVHSQAMTRRRQSTRNVNNRQGREQSILDADNRVGENINASANIDHVDPQDGIFKQHKTRGFTYMPHVYAISSNNNSQPVKVEFNEYGKPIGPNKSKFVEFLGSIARNGKVAPLNYPDWHKVPKIDKARMMDMIKLFIPTECEKIVFKALGRSWRNFKCRIKNLYFNPVGSRLRSITS